MLEKFVFGVAGSLLAVGCGDGATSQARKAAESGELGACESMRTYTAALGEATIRCLGTFDTSTYYVDSDGALRPSFSACVRPDARQALRDINDLLSLQEPEAELPQARSCFAGAYQAWAEEFRTEGSHQCPTFSVMDTRGTPTLERVADLTRRYDFAGMLTGNADPPDASEFHQDFVYDVAFSEADASQPCGDALSCATSCGRAFPGFHIGTEGGRFVGDPTWWVADEYPPRSTAMYPSPLNYHPMSFYGPLPGDLYGHRNRVGEACSRWAGGALHYILGLKLLCFSSTACVSKCAP